MIATIVVLEAFPDTEALLFAFGFAAATVMFSTSVMLAVQMHVVKGWPIVVGVAYFMTFGVLDALFWGAAFKKLPSGAWVPLVIGVSLFVWLSIVAFFPH